MEQTRARRRQRKPKRMWKRLVMLIVLLVVVGGSLYGFSIYSNAKGTVNGKMHKDVDSIDTSVAKQKLKAGKPLNILLLGVDKRKGDSGRSDALMVLSLDPKNDQMKLISIPRDTRTEIVGRGTLDKINHAYAFGGTDMSVATVENLLHIDLDYYVEVNMEGLSKLVDTIGGVTVNNKIDWYDEGYYKKGFHWTKGELQLDGKQALGYVRMRHLDPEGDFGRTKRQRMVIQAIVDKGASIASVPKINSLIDVMGNNMETNMDFGDMKSLLLGYKDTRKHSDSYMLQGTGQKINGIYYYVVPDSETQKVNGMINGSKSAS